MIMEANGVTDMGKALQLVAEQLDPEMMPQQGAAPCSRSYFRRSPH